MFGAWLEKRPTTSADAGRLAKRFCVRATFGTFAAMAIGAIGVVVLDARYMLDLYLMLAFTGGVFAYANALDARRSYWDLKDKGL